MILAFAPDIPHLNCSNTAQFKKSYVGIVVPKGHELILKEAFTFRDITTYPQIFFTRTSPMRKLQEQIYKDYQISAAPACEAEEIEVILNMIEHGFGISVLPYLDIFKNRNVDVLPLSEAKWESTFYAIRRRDGVRSHGEKNNLEPDYTQFKKGQVGILGKPGKWRLEF